MLVGLVRFVFLFVVCFNVVFEDSVLVLSVSCCVSVLWYSVVF